MSSELVVHTIPSHRLGIFSAPTPEPFRRVVGMDMDSETVWIPPTGRPAKVYGYAPADTEPEALKLPEGLVLRAKVFFRHWLASPSRSQPYNCHSFADFMEDAQTVSEDFSVRPRFLAAQAIGPTWSEAPHPLELGQRGVIGGVQPPRGLRKERVRAYHSLIGLGPDSPDCLQVTQMGGFMALDSYDSVLGYYGKRYVDRGGAQLYTRNPLGNLVVSASELR